MQSRLPTRLLPLRNSETLVLTTHKSLTGARPRRVRGGQLIAMWERTSANSKQVISHARERAMELHRDRVQAEHLLLGICLISDCIAGRIFLQKGVESETLVSTNLSESQPGATDHAKEISFAVPAKRTLEHSVDEAYRMNGGYDGQIGTECLLIGILREIDSVAAQDLQSHGLNASDVRPEVERSLLAHPKKHRIQCIVRGAICSSPPI